MDLQNFIIYGAIVAVIGYLLGSLSFSIIITKLYKKGDIRNYGSGNAGMTNVLRSVGKLPAAMTFILDFSKGIVSALIGYWIFVGICEAQGLNLAYANFGSFLGGFASVLGHIYPLYFKFKGGKAVATAAAVVAIADWRIFLVVVSVFIISFSIKRMVSLSSVLGAISYPIATFIITYFNDYLPSPGEIDGIVGINYVLSVTVISLIMGSLVVVKHKDNIKRIFAGEEKPIFGKGSEKSIGKLK